MKIELFTENNKKIYKPVLLDEVVWTTEMKESPGKLSFKVIKDDKLKIEEGNSVIFKIDNKGVFYGFIFTIKFDKDFNYDITAYDQIRYLKNKDTYVYTNKTASDVIKMIANDFNLNVGVISPTTFKIKSRIEDNSTLLDIIYNALDLELTNKNKIFVFYDDFGKLMLSPLNKMKLGLIIDAETAENFDYSSSIDSDTYNKIKLTFDNEKSGKRDVYIAQDGKNINKWGILQHFDTLEEGENGTAKASALLKYYNRKTKELKITGAFGNVKVRGGSIIIVNLKLEKELLSYMIVDKCSHTFSDNSHFMDLTLKGGEFNS